MVSGADKFKFVSPGIQVAEINNTRRPGVQAGIGPVIIHRSQRGPALRPVTVGSFSEFVELFGEPHPGGQGGDVWRDGNNLAPMYGAYAAQAWLKNRNNLTFVRLLGAEHQDATTAGKAGWQVGSAHDATLSTGGAFGLFIIDSGTAGVVNTGSLAAIWYLESGAIELSGTDRDGAAVTGTAVLIASQGTDKEFKALIKDSSGNIDETISFNFNNTSKKYARSVFNTNPTLLNSNVTRTAQQKTYFLGETFEKNLETYVSGTSAGGQWGVILSLKSGTIDQNDQRMSMTPAKTGWFISQDLTSDSASFNPSQMTKLFRLVAHDSGEWEQKNLKVSVIDIKPSLTQENMYGTFTVQIRRAKDNDNAPEIIEQFVQCTLDPYSPNYVARKIGDKFLEWDDTERRYREFGNYENKSRFVRVEMNGDVDAGATNPELLPFGFLGPVQFKGFSAISGGAEARVFDDSSTDFATVFAQGNADIYGSKADANEFIKVGASAFTGTFKFPAIQLRANSEEGDVSNPKEAYFGINSNRINSTRFDRGYVDLVRKLPESLDADPDSNSSLEYSFVFTLDDLKRTSGSTTSATWTSGSRASGDSFTAVSGVYNEVLDQGFDRFTAPLVGGFDGLDITEKEPFNNRVINGGTETTRYEFNSVKRAIDSVADAEIVDMNILAIPGVTNTGITDQMLNTAAKRSDCVAVIDVEGGFIPASENTNGDSSAANRGNYSTAITNIKSRAINNSYGCTYYPWLQYRDVINGIEFWGPPSIAAIGVMASTEKNEELWIAPAGFTRGGLTQEAGGLPVIGIRERLKKDERDKLYEVNINPIAKFPAEGIVIMGQKTLEAVPSATDRLNVRLMLNHLKKVISKVAATVLFDNNIQATWNRFVNAADPELAKVASTFGLEDYLIKLDKSTTTDELKDRNTMYAKIFLKPAKAIEFIGLDFVITKSGAAFDDL